MNMYRHKQSGFTLLEILVVIAIIGILTTMLTLNFNKARQATKDDVRKTELKELQLALRLYKSQYGYYPAEGCAGVSSGESPSNTSGNWHGQGAEVNVWTGSKPIAATWYYQCDEYIVGLVPDFIDELPTDPNDGDGTSRAGYHYQVSSDGSAYKLLTNSVETKFVKGYDNEFARCPGDVGESWCGSSGPPELVYSVYSAGAESW